MTYNIAKINYSILHRSDIVTSCLRKRWQGRSSFEQLQWMLFFRAAYAPLVKWKTRPPTSAGGFHWCSSAHLKQSLSLQTCMQRNESRLLTSNTLCLSVETFIFCILCLHLESQPPGSYWLKPVCTRTYQYMAVGIMIWYLLPCTGSMYWHILQVLIENCQKYVPIRTCRAHTAGRRTASQHAARCGALAPRPHAA